MRASDARVRKDVGVRLPPAALTSRSQDAHAGNPLLRRYGCATRRAWALDEPLAGLGCRWGRFAIGMPESSLGIHAQRRPGKPAPSSAPSVRERSTSSTSFAPATLRWIASFPKSETAAVAIYVSRKADVARLDEFVGPKR